MNIDSRFTIYGLYIGEGGYMSTGHVSSDQDLFLYPRSPKGEGGILYYLCPSVLPSVQDIFRRIFLSNC
jgi:hypothetical protein